MKNKKGFTLVETLAVIILLGVILMIAVPSINNVVDRNNKRRLKEAAEMFVVLAKQKLETDTSIEYPDSGKVVVLFLNSIDGTQLQNIVGEGVNLGKSTTNRDSKAVFSYDVSKNKWVNEFVVLYDTKGNAAYLTSGTITANNDTNNRVDTTSEEYQCRIINSEDENCETYIYEYE